METPPAPPMEALRTTIARLRAPEGCPWDREQTHHTLRPCMLEEAYEAVEAMTALSPETADPLATAHLCEELGDVLLQVLLHSQIAEEAGRFTLDDVARELNAKLIRRHPHVFGDTAGSAPDTRAVLQRWGEIKQSEREALGREAKNAVHSALDGVPGALPSLLYALKITNRAAKVGFDWELPLEVAGKLREELAETEEALAQGRPEKIEEELGDLLFSVVNFARKMRVEPEAALRRATHKFEHRFRQMEARLALQSRVPSDCTLAEMDEVWNAIKAQERQMEGGV